MRALSVTVLGLALIATPTLAQKAHRYDPGAEVTVTGTVVDYHESKDRGDHPGLHFILEIPAVAPETPSEVEGAGTPDLAPQGEEAAAAVEAAPPADVETLEVHACPVRLLSQLDFPVEKGDELTVTGSRPGGGSVVIAREIKKGMVSLRLRDEKGVPIWTGLP